MGWIMEARVNVRSGLTGVRLAMKTSAGGPEGEEELSSREPKDFNQN